LTVSAIGIFPRERKTTNVHKFKLNNIGVNFGCSVKSRCAAGVFLA